MAIHIVTGAAGFIGSNLAEALIQQGENVIGIDNLNDYYNPELKRRNLSSLQSSANFTFLHQEIQDCDWGSLLNQAQFVYHQAAQAGVRASWGKSFHDYTERNITATQILLEAAKESSALQRLVFASTSSIYGDAETLPTSEAACPKPISPYGITKLAAERLCQLYHQNFQVPVTMLRYFSVYGPRQRPDMAFHKFYKAVLRDEAIPIYGDGQQTRDFTFVGDIVTANLTAAESQAAVGEVFNIGGGSRAVLAEVLEKMEAIVGHEIRRDYQERARGDARHTAADVSKAKELMNFEPKVSLYEGLEQEWKWVQQLYKR